MCEAEIEARKLRFIPREYGRGGGYTAWRGNARDKQQMCVWSKGERTGKGWMVVSGGMVVVDVGHVDCIS